MPRLRPYKVSVICSPSRWQVLVMDRQFRSTRTPYNDEAAARAAFTEAVKLGTKGTVNEVLLSDPTGTIIDEWGT